MRSQTDLLTIKYQEKDTNVEEVTGSKLSWSPGPRALLPRLFAQLSL